MEPDLRDILSAWLGGQVEATRREEVLARARQDESFRLAFVAEVHMLGTLKAVQAAEPRWLQFEDEIGWSAAERVAGESPEDGIMRQLGEPPGPRSSGRWRLWSTAAALLVVGAAALVSRSRAGREDRALAPTAVPSPTRSPSAVDVSHGLAMVVKLDGVCWEPELAPRLSEGDLLAAGRFQLRSGRATLSMLNGVVLVIEGPADVELVSIDRVYCHRGRLRARVPEGAEGFIISSPGSAVMDLGTEFGLNVESDGTSRVKVFEGAVEAAVLNVDGTPRHIQLMKKENSAFEIHPQEGRIKPASGPEQFVPPSDLAARPLILDPSYPGTILQSRPWGYWRFETLADGTVPNEIAGRPALRATGPIRLAGAPAANRSAVFGAGEPGQYLAMDGLWEPPARRPVYAVEFWFLSDIINLASLVSMVAPKDTNKHQFLLELTCRSRNTWPRPASVRFLHRWPPGPAGGDNIYSHNYYVPYRWHHLVAQVSGDGMELFLDGVAAGSLPLDADRSSRACQVVLGRMTTIPRHVPLNGSRPFVGRMDEVALYDHTLSLDEVRVHHRLASQGIGLGVDRGSIGIGARDAAAPGISTTPGKTDPKVPNDVR